MTNRHNPFANRNPVPSNIFNDENDNAEVLDWNDQNEQQENNYEIEIPEEEAPVYQGFSMGDNTAHGQPEIQEPPLVINKPEPEPKVFKRNTLGSYTQPNNPFGGRGGRRAPLPSRSAAPPQQPAPVAKKPAKKMNNPFQAAQDNQILVEDDNQDNDVYTADEPIDNNIEIEQPEQYGQEQYEEQPPQQVQAPAPRQPQRNPFNKKSAAPPRMQQPQRQQQRFAAPPQNNQAKTIQVNNPFGIPEPQEQEPAGNSNMSEIPLEGQSNPAPAGEGAFADDLPLLEELEIDISKIKQKFLAIITQRGYQENNIATYDDMAGPLLVFILFGVLELLKGKVEFGNIYGFGLTGTLGVYLIINLLSQRGQYVELYSCMSILGYSLLPMCLVGAISIVYSLNQIIGYVICSLVVFWCTVSATRFFEYGLDMQDRKYLIAYPIILFYSVFCLVTIF